MPNRHGQIHTLIQQSFYRAIFYTVVVIIRYYSLNSMSASDVQQIAVYLQCTVCLMGQYAFCQNLTQLYAFLIEAVYIP